MKPMIDAFSVLLRLVTDEVENANIIANAASSASFAFSRSGGHDFRLKADRRG